MYSLILMAAATGSGDVSGFGWRNAGCNGCTGTVVYSSCQGSSCYGSYSYSGCSGCYGSYRPAGCFGFSTWSEWSGASCHGCTGYTGCTGSTVRPGRGFFQRHSCSGASCQGSSCHGCTGCTGCTGMPTYGCSGCGGTIVMPAAVAVPAVAVPEMNASANIVVEVPAGATLSVDGKVVAGEGRTRKFHTPGLAVDRQFFYEMRAEVTVDGKTVAEDLKVVVSGGQTVTTSFGVLLAAAEKAGGAKVATK